MDSDEEAGLLDDEDLMEDYNCLGGGILNTCLPEVDRYILYGKYSFVLYNKISINIEISCNRVYKKENSGNVLQFFCIFWTFSGVAE